MISHRSLTRLILGIGRRDGSGKPSSLWVIKPEFGGRDFSAPIMPQQHFSVLMSFGLCSPFRADTEAFPLPPKMLKRLAAC
jgi:hypothetical protein